MELGIVFGVLFGSLVCGWLGWRSVKAAFGLGKAAVEAGVLTSRRQTVAVGQVQGFGLALGAPLLAIGVVFVPACLFELGERHLKVQETRTQALETLARNKEMVAHMTAVYEKKKATLSPAKRKEYEQDIRQRQWLANQTEEQVLADADALLPETRMGKFWDSNIEQTNWEISSKLSAARLEAAEQFAKGPK